MRSLPNILSFIRIPLAFLFFQENLVYRCLAILLAMISDGLDGYLARKYKVTSKLGTLLDPIADKFFVLMVLGVLLNEKQLTLGEAVTMFSRDFAVLLFGCYLAIIGDLEKYQFRSIVFGKVTTCLQFFVLIGLTCHLSIPYYVFATFVVLGALALLELYLTRSVSPKGVDGS